MNLEIFRKHEHCLRSLMSGIDPDDYFYAFGMLKEATKSISDTQCTTHDLKELENIPLTISSITIGDLDWKIPVPFVKLKNNTVTFFPGAIDFVLTSLNPK